MTRKSAPEAEEIESGNLKRSRLGGRTETGKETKTEREGRQGRNGTGNIEWGGRCERGGQQGMKTKRRPLSEDVSEYREFYEGEVTN